MGDQKYTERYFGVTAEQSSRSGFRAFKPKAGLKEIGVNVELIHQTDRQWGAAAGVTYSH